MYNLGKDMRYPQFIDGPMRFLVNGGIFTVCIERKAETGRNGAAEKVGREGQYSDGCLIKALAIVLPSSLYFFYNFLASIDAIIRRCLLGEFRRC